MSFQLAKEHAKQSPRSSWANVAFIVEAMLLLVFLIVSLVIFLQMFSASLVRSSESEQITQAVAAASSVAERFAADPATVQSEYTEGTMRVTCNVAPEARAQGTLYTARISVYDAAQTDSAGVVESPSAVYALTVSKYEHGGR